MILRSKIQSWLNKLEIREVMTLTVQHADQLNYMKGTVSQNDDKPWNEYSDDYLQLLKFSIYQKQLPGLKMLYREEYWWKAISFW